MKNYVFKKAILAVIFIFALIIMESVLFRYVGLGETPIYWIIDYSAYFIMGCMLFLLPVAIERVFAILGVSISTLLVVTNLIMFKSADRIFDWQMIALANEAGGVADWIKVPWLEVVSVVVLCLGVVLTACVYVRKTGSFYKPFIKSVYSIVSMVWLGVLVTIQTCSRVAILNDYKVDTYFISNSYNYTMLDSAYNGIKSYGLFGYYATSLIRMVVPPIAPSFKVSSKDFSFDRYTSELTGLCEGDNVLLIIGESVDEYGISPELAPTLYALKNGADLTNVGINNFYNVSRDANGQKVLERKDYVADGDSYIHTGVDIFEGIEFDKFGLDFCNYKSDEVTNKSEERILTGNSMSYEYSLPKMLKNVGYNTNYIHGNKGTYYGRDYTMKVDYEFNNTLFYDQDMVGKIESTGDLACFLRDSDIMSYYEAHQDEFDILPDDAFLSVIMTITAHGWYSTEWELVAKNLEFVNAISADATEGLLGCYNNLEDEVLKLAVGNFFAKAIDTERMVALLVDELFVEGRLDDTVIVYASDHSAYAGDVSPFKEIYYNNVLKTSWSGDASKFNVPAFIYSTKINNSTVSSYAEQRKVEHLTSAYDIVPTVLSLVGVDFVQERYMGYSVINQSIETGKCVYNKVTGSTSTGIFIGEDYTSKDGLTYNSNIVLSDDMKKRFPSWCNDYKSKKHFVEHVLNRGEEYIAIK